MDASEIADDKGPFRISGAAGGLGEAPTDRLDRLLGLCQAEPAYL